MAHTPTEYKKSMIDAHKPDALRRLKRIEGQIRGISRMLEEDRYCIEVLQQVQAVRAALNKVEGLVLKDHAAHCVQNAIESGDAGEQSEKFAELIDLFDRMRR